MSAHHADIVVVFDGGAIGNPGAGYGSYCVYGVIHTPSPVRIDFPGTTTNNQAEYLTLIRALESVIAGLERRGRAADGLSIEVFSDSQLVVEQVNGRWKVRKPEIRPRVEEAQALLGRFAAWTLQWHPRSESVRILGH